MRRTALVLKLNTPDMIRGGSCGKAFSVPCLDAGFLISTDYKIIWSKPFPVPYTLIEVQHIRRLFRKIRITRKYPTAILPRFDGIITHPTPNRGATYGSNDTITNSLTGNISMAQPRKRGVSLAWQLARKRFDFHYNLRGKKDAVCRALDDLGDRPSVHQRTVFAIC